MLAPRTRAAAILVGLALALGACGQSDEDQAREDVCNARDDIAQQIQSLQGLTLGTATKEQLTSSLEAIQKDLQQIADARGDLNDELKQQVQTANETFKSSLDKAVSQVTESRSLSAAVTSIKAAIAQLGTSYREALQPIDCS